VCVHNVTGWLSRLQNSKKGDREKITKAIGQGRWVCVTLSGLFKTLQYFCKRVLLVAEISKTW